MINFLSGEDHKNHLAKVCKLQYCSQRQSSWDCCIDCKPENGRVGFEDLKNTTSYGLDKLNQSHLRNKLYRARIN